MRRTRGTPRVGRNEYVASPHNRAYERVLPPRARRAKSVEIFASQVLAEYNRDSSFKGNSLFWRFLSVSRIWLRVNYLPHGGKILFEVLFKCAVLHLYIELSFYWFLDQEYENIN